MMNCSECRTVCVSGRQRYAGALQVTRDDQNGGHFHFSATESGQGIRYVKSFLIPSFATMKGIAVDLVLAAYNHLACAKVEIVLRFRQQSETVFAGSPLMISVSRIESRLQDLFMLHELHPRRLSIRASVDCFVSYNVVSTIQLSNSQADVVLNVSDSGLSGDAKQLLAQARCWFPPPSNPGAVLAKHALAALVIGHQFDELNAFMKKHPEYGGKLAWTFKTSAPALCWERFVYCKKSAFLCVDPVMIMNEHEHPPGHWHRLRSSILGVSGVIMDLYVYPPRLPLNLVLRIAGPQMVDDSIYISPEHSTAAFCESIKQRRTSFNRAVLLAAFRLLGKCQIARRRYWERVRSECAPGSEAYFLAMQRFEANKHWKGKKTAELKLYLGYKDLKRAAANKRRILRQKLLVRNRARRRFRRRKAL